jgi:hypothetical protein
MEPRKFWSAVRPERKSKCTVDNETISKYVKNVLAADPPELSEEVLNLINNDHFENVDKGSSSIGFWQKCMIDGLHRWDVVEKGFLHYESFVEL